MIILGLILLVLGFVLHVDVLVWVGLVVAILGAALNFSGRRIY